MLAGDRDRVAVEDAGVGEALEDHRHAAGGVEVGGDEAAAGLEVGEQRRRPRDPLEVVHRQLDPELVGERDQVQDAVGRAAGGADAGDRVLQRVAGDHLARGDVVGEDPDHQLADFLGDGVLVVVFGRDHRRAAGADPQRLEGAGHRVGGELAAAGAGAGAGDALQLVQFLIAHVARVVGADRLEDVEDGDVAAVPVAGGDRAAVEQDRGDVEPGQRHRAAGDRLVAGAEGDDRVELVAAGHQLDRVGDHLAADQRGLHPLGAHRHPVGDGDGVELHRRAAGGADALFDVLGQGAEVEVAGHRLGPGVGDPDRRPAEGVVVEPDALHVGARVGAVGAVEDGRRAGTGKLGLSAVRAHGRNLQGAARGPSS